MERLEDEYEDELIDAFDAPGAEEEAPTKAPSTSPLRTNVYVGQPTRPKDEKFQNKKTLYPTFDTATTSEEAGTEVETKKLHVDDKGRVQQHAVAAPVSMYQEEELMSEVELLRKRQQIENEINMYRKRFDHVAQVLAGETPHQIQERKKRGEERQERQEKRHEAMETRLQHQIERLEEREERRARIQARHHRASRSSSPSELLVDGDEVRFKSSS